MSLSQWTVSHSSGSATHSLSASSPLEGTSSLVISSSGAATRTIAGLTSGAAVTTGKIRTLFNISDATSNGFGVFGMMQSSIAHGSSAYWAALNFTSTTLVRLKKGVADDLAASIGDLATATHGFSGGYQAATTYALQLQWQRDSDSGFVLLTVSIGVATDFSDLAVKITHTDNSSPYSSGLSAGVGYESENSSARNVKVDMTQIFRV